MKKLLLLFLLVAGGVSTASAGTKTTVYYAVSSSVVGSYTVKLNVQTQHDGGDVWSSYDMTKTGLTYDGKDIYTCTYTDLWNGVQTMQFQLYEGSTWKAQQQPISSWKGVSEYNGKMYVHDTDWTTFSASSYSRSVTEGNFGTICLPFASTAVTGAKVYKIVSTVGTGASMTAINLEEVSSLEAAKPYIFQATGSTLTATLSGSATTTPVAAFGMVGNLSTETVTLTGAEDPTCYVIQSNKVKQVVTGGDGVTVGLYRAYIDLYGIGEASARGTISIGFADETTGINNLTPALNEGVVYDLQGRKVAQPTKGLYIVNGKKVIK